MANELPILIESDAATILADLKATFESATGKALVAGQPEYNMIVAPMAYAIFLERQRLNTACANMLLPFSNAPMLDYIVSLLNVVRLTAQPATCIIRFTLVVGHGDVVIPIGTRVSDSNGVAIFLTDVDTTILSTETLGYIDIETTCLTDGITGNNFAVGEISTIMDPLAYVTIASNTTITANGTDSETDSELRDRTKLASSQFSVAGPLNAYKFFAKSVSPLLIDVGVETNTEDNTIPIGIVRVSGLLANGETPDSSLRTKMSEYLNKEDIRPMSDQVQIFDTTKKHFTLLIQLTKYANYTALNSLTTAVEAIILEYKRVKLLSLGLNIVATEIESLCRIDGVYDVLATIVPVSGSLTGRNYVINANQIGILDSYSIEIIGSNNG